MPSRAGSGGGLSHQSGSMTLKNTVVAGNTPANCLGSITSAGYNLDSANTCGFTQPGDLINSDPQLGPALSYEKQIPRIAALAAAPG